MPLNNNITFSEELIIPSNQITLGKIVGQGEDIIRFCANAWGHCINSNSNYQW